MLTPCYHQVDSGYTTPFAKLHALYKGNEGVQTRIRGTMMRADFTDSKKVEIIAGILAQTTTPAVSLSAQSVFVS